jgi:hypothetical protein
VKHDRCQTRPEIELFHERIRGISLVDNCRKTVDGGDLELPAKRALLFGETWHRSRKIEPRFTNGNWVQNLDGSLQICY